MTAELIAEIRAEKLTSDRRTATNCQNQRLCSEPVDAAGFFMSENEDLIGQISVVYSNDGWQVVTHVGFFACKEDAEAYAVEVIEEHDGTPLPSATAIH